MSVYCYNGRFVVTAKSLETNVAVVRRVDCMNDIHCFWMNMKFISSDA
jgi:hypothetical protein